MKELIHIAFAVDNNYAPQCGTALASLFDSNKENLFHIHILHKELNKQNFERLRIYIADNGQSCTFHRIDDKAVKNAPIEYRHISIASYYRIFLPDILPQTVGRIIYLDADILIRNNLLPLWNIDINGYAIGAVEEIVSAKHFHFLGIASYSNYFNSGILLIDLAYWRTQKTTAACLECIAKNRRKIKYWDQDVLNIVLEKKWLHLDHKWNVSHKIYFNREEYAHLDKKYLEQLAGNPGIVHFSGASKPWGFWNRHPFKKEYLRYRSMTAWPIQAPGIAAVMAETFLRIKEKIRMIFIR